MLTRLLGLLLMVRAVTPIIIVVLIAFIGAIILNDLQSAIASPAQKIREEVDTLQTHIDSSREQFETVVQEVEAVGQEIQAFTNLDFIPDIPVNLTIPSLTIPNPSIDIPTISITWSRALGIRYPSAINIGTTSITIPIPDIPSFSVPIPFADEIENAFGDIVGSITGVFNIFDDAFESIADLSQSLEAIPSSVEVITNELSRIVNTIIRLSAGWGSAFGIVVLVILILLINYFATSILDDLRRGWRMLSGQPV